MKFPCLPAFAVLFLCISGARAGNEAEVAVYNGILASVKPGQTTVEMGDMIVPVERVTAWRDAAMGLRSATRTEADAWPGGVVYYTFNANVSAEKRAHFTDACAEWATFANLTFTPRTNEPNYIRVNEDPSLDGGNSAVGMSGGRQDLNVGAEAWSRFVLVHEIGHSLGLIHEHQRSDRDTYVSVVTGNISFGQSAQFTRIPSSTHLKPYDFLSIMHYARDSFTDTPGLDTLTCKTGYEHYQDAMGRFPTDRLLSRGDRESIATLYGPGPALSTVVTNTKDSGPGSLRAALYHALDVATDAPGTPVAVTFQIPLTDPGYSDGVFTVQLSGRLPGPGPGVTVDGTTQTAFTGDTNPAGPEVVLNGARTIAPEYTHAFVLGDNGSVVRGLVINGFSDMGIILTGQNNRVEGCYIGTNAAGTAAVPNGTSGVDFREGATGNTIGGTTAAQRNVISGNTRQGVVVTDSENNVIQGNYIGTNATGTAALGNGWSGMAIFNVAANNTVGPGNVISGNNNQGMVIDGTGTTGNQVTGNFIGVNAAGSAALPNGQAGVQIQQGAAGNFIGGAGAADGNVISSNGLQGVVMSGAGTEGNVVRGNKLGTDATGNAALPNAGAGVALFGMAENNTVGPDNLISGNGTAGVVISEVGTAGNTVTGNVIGLNAAGTATLGNTTAGVFIHTAAANNAVGPGNVIGGNGAQGVSITGAATSGNTVTGNVIGLNATGTVALGNFGAGVAVFSAAANNTVGPGNVVSGNGAQGVSITGAGTAGNKVRGNVIGLNAAGTAALPNAFSGVELSVGATASIVGGEGASDGNFISGNTRNGIVIQSAGTAGNVVRGNYVGTDGTGMAAVPNGMTGITIQSAAAHNTVGPGNVISGNTNQGVLITQAGTNGNTVRGNIIGLNASGTAALPNGLAGAEILSGAQENVIGGPGATDGNVISGNTRQGLVLHGAGTGGNVVRGNYIGTNAAGNAAVPNGLAGMAVFGGAANNMVGPDNVISGNTSQGIVIADAGTTGNGFIGNIIGLNAARSVALPNVLTGVTISLGAQGNVIGGGGAADGNLISGNTRQGVLIQNSGTTGNAVRGNYIGTNASGMAALGNGWSGVTILGGAANNIVGPGNVISGNGNQGVLMTEAGTSGNTVRGNFIGLNAAGTAALPNAWAGVQAGAAALGNIIGGLRASDRNIISGNALQGVAINGANTSGNFVRGNYIGTNAAGTAAVPNVTTGIEIYGAATANTVGGVEAGAGNVISGNLVRGLSISGAGTSANVVAGNLIGLNAAGTAALANAGAGVVIFNTAPNSVIGAEAGGRNFIAGNSNSGIRINGAGANGTRIVGNSIGVSPAGTVVPNVGDGVEAFGGSAGTVVGGSAPGSGNLIRGNTRDGVSAYDAATVVTVQGNSIYGNGGEGIDLAGNGVTANDAGDSDAGPNGLQNYPIISSAVLGTGTAIAGVLNTTAGAAVRVDYYASTAGDEGQYFIGSRSGTSDAGGNLILNTTLAARVPAGFVITATATGPANNTSEFSAPRAVTVTDSDSDGMPDAWESANGLANGSNDAALDADGDGESNLAEFRAGTDPRSSASVLAAELSASGGTMTLGFTPVPGITYRVEYSPSLGPGSWLLLADQLHAGGTPLLFTDPASAGVSHRFYRLLPVP
jgi:hypothetical protein